MAVHPSQLRSAETGAVGPAPPRVCHMWSVKETTARLAGSQGRGPASSPLQKLRARGPCSSAAAQPNSSAAVVWDHRAPLGRGPGEAEARCRQCCVLNRLVLAQRLSPPAWSSHGAVGSRGPACPSVKPPTAVLHEGGLLPDRCHQKTVHKQNLMVKKNTCLKKKIQNIPQND